MIFPFFAHLKEKGKVTSIMAISTVTSTRSIGLKGLVLLGLFALLLGCDITLFPFISIRLTTSVALVSSRFLILVTFPLVLSLGFR